jgi:putative addiction module component (TIGR02574 family)
MTAIADEILNRALALDEEERVKIAERLWDSVESAGTVDLTDEQKATLDRRWEEIESGKVKCRPVKEVISELRAKYGC